MIMIKRKKRGSITVEASIFLPIFFIGILTLAYLIKIMWIQEGAFFTFEKEARELAKRTYASEVLGQKGENFLGGSFELFLKSKLYDSQPRDIQNARLTEYKYRYTYQGIDGMILADLDYDIKIKMPISFYDKASIKERLLFRAFIGTDGCIDPAGYEKMEREQDAEPVWVFPRAGERYHGENCTYITNRPKKMVLTRALRKRYDDCHLCKPEGLSNGNIVYCYSKTGEVIHRGSCVAVDKYVISMEKEKSKKEGYTPCMKCGGG